MFLELKLIFTWKHITKKLIIHNKLDLEIKGNSLYFDTCVN